jgi:ABC-type multidrug transport system fused ATPase/permease subunit
MQIKEINAILKLWSFLSPRRKLQLYLIFMLMIFASFAELFSIGAALPFLSAIIDPEALYNSKNLYWFIYEFDIKTPKELLFYVVIIFSIATVIAGLIRLLLLWFNSTLSYAIGADLGLDMFRKALNQPYLSHTSNNSSLVISGITNKTNSLISGLIIPALNIVSALVMILIITISIIIFNPVVSLLTFLGFSLIYLFIIKITHRRLINNSFLIAEGQSKVIRVLQEGLGGIRDVLIDRSQEFFCSIFHKADASLRKAEGENTFIGSSPRFFVEALGMLLIAWTAFFLSSNEFSGAMTLPILGVLVLSAQRLLPVIQQGYGAWVAVKAHKQSVDDALILLSQPLPHSNGITAPCNFNKSISFNDISFRYAENLPWVLKNINLEVQKGEVIGIIGKTGSGKSTLIDILLGLLVPTSGRLLIDGAILNSNTVGGWQSHLSHVPQTIFLTDGTVEENVAFTVSTNQIDSIEVLKACKVAQLEPVLARLKGGIKSFVGERGVRLSGGQRQRVGIARSLYRNAKVIVFDEATSALDHETEESVINAIRSISKNITIFMISHRHSTLRYCTKIIEIDAGNIIWTGDYEGLISRNEN